MLPSVGLIDDGTMTQSLNKECRAEGDPWPPPAIPVRLHSVAPYSACAKISKLGCLLVQLRAGIIDCGANETRHLTVVTGGDHEYHQSDDQFQNRLLLAVFRHAPYAAAAGSTPHDYGANPDGDQHPVLLRSRPWP